MVISLGSTSQDKKKFLADTLKHLKINAEIECLAVESGVGEQPIGQSKVIKGAVNRARNAFRASARAELGVGLEGGLEKIGEEWFLVCVAAIYGNKRQPFVGIGSKLGLPTEVSKCIEKGLFFGKLIREYRDNDKNSKSEEMIDELVTRENSFTEAIRNAFYLYLNK